jgi:hypothetical protein
MYVPKLALCQLGLGREIADTQKGGIKMTTLESVEKIMAQVETLWRKTATSALYMLSYDATELRKQIVLDNNKLLLAQDGIRIALKTAGYENVDSMTQFERASAILNMAQELAALTTIRVSVGWAEGRGYNGRVTA